VDLEGWEQHHAAYRAKVRITVRACETTVIREASGTGEGKAPTPGQAHDLALKGAETDATKRALATFGNQFGLTLYEREQNGARKPSRGEYPELVRSGPWLLRSATGTADRSIATAEGFVQELKTALMRAGDVEALFATVNRYAKQQAYPKVDAGVLGNALKQRAITLVKGTESATDVVVSEGAAEDPDKAPLRKRSQIKTSPP
jgi:hypothetical protein